MSNQEFEILKSRIQGLSAKVDAVTILASNQEQRSFQDNNNLNRFNEAGLTNPLEQDIDANNFDIENIKDFSATNGKFITLKVGDNTITGDSGGGGGSSGIFIRDDDAVTEASRGAGAQAITILNFAGDGVTVGAPEDVSGIGETTFKQTITVPPLSLKLNDSLVVGGPFRTLDFRGTAVTSVADTSSLGATTYTAAITINQRTEEPDTVATVEANRGTTIKNLLNSGVNFKWDMCSDPVAGADQYDRFGGSIDNITSGDDLRDQTATCVSLSDDGKYMVVGAPRGQNGGDPGDGYITLWEYEGGEWNILGRRIGVAAGALGRDSSRAGSQFGYSVSINGHAGRGTNETIIVAVGEPLIVSGKGALHIFKFNSNITNHNDHPFDVGLEKDNSTFGTASPDYITGAIDCPTSDNPTGSGARFGTAVQLNGRGDICAVGTPGLGRIYIYTRAAAGSGTLMTTTGVWTDQLIVGNGASSSRPDSSFAGVFSIGGYGSSLSLTSDGTKLATSFTAFNPGSADQSGILKVYEITHLANDDSDTPDYDYWGYNGDPHTQTGLIGADNTVGSHGEGLGASVKLSDDGNIVVAGSPQFRGQNVGASAGESGRIRVFKKGSNASDTWSAYGTIEPKFKNVRNGGSGTGDYTYSRYSHVSNGEAPNTFGRQITISSDGNIIAMGSSQPDQPYSNIGMFRAYYYSGDSNTNHTWSQLGQTVYGAHKDAHFGRCIAMNKDGTRLAVTAPFQDAPFLEAGQEHYENVDTDAARNLAGAAMLYCLNTGVNPLDIRRLSTFLNGFA